MSAIARYLLVFLLGWSGAVWSYSDVIYKDGNKPAQEIKTPQQTNDISLPKELKLPPTASGRFTSKKKMIPPKNISGNKTSTKNPVRHGSSVLISLFELILMKRPLTFLGVPGLIILVAGIITSTISLMLFNQTGHFSVPTTLVSVVFLTVGVMLILVSGILFSINRTIQSR